MLRNVRETQRAHSVRKGLSPFRRCAAFTLLSAMSARFQDQRKRGKNGPRIAPRVSGASFSVRRVRALLRRSSRPIPLCATRPLMSVSIGEDSVMSAGAGRLASGKPTVDLGACGLQLLQRHSVEQRAKGARNALGSVRAVGKGNRAANVRQRANGVLQGVLAYVKVVPCHGGACMSHDALDVRHRYACVRGQRDERMA